MNKYEGFLAGYPHIVNAAGTLTRLGGTLMRPETVQAMADASAHFFDMAEPQAWASEVIADATGAEAGHVTSDAAAALTLAAAACIAGLNPRTMEELPSTQARNEIIIARPHRNSYDHALCQDHESEVKRWRKMLELVANRLMGLETLEVRLSPEDQSGRFPVAEVRFDEARLHRSAVEISRELASGRPRIMLNEQNAREGILLIDPFNLDTEGAEAIVSRLLDLCAP